MPDKRLYFYFYLIGRRDDAPRCQYPKAQSPNDIARTILSSKCWVRDLVREAAERYRAPLHEHRQYWIKENIDEIVEAGGDSSRAWEMYCDGCVDQYAADLEPDVLAEMADILDDIDDDDDQDFDDEDQEEEDATDTKDVDSDDGNGAPTYTMDQEDDDREPSSLQAKYKSWEKLGRSACDGSDDLMAMLEMAAKPLYAAASSVWILDNYWPLNKQRIRREWRRDHLASVESDGLKPAKAYSRWCEGWCDVAIERIAAAKASRVKMTPMGTDD